MVSETDGIVVWLQLRSFAALRMTVPFNRGYGQICGDSSERRTLHRADLGRSRLRPYMFAVGYEVGLTK